MHLLEFPLQKLERLLFVAVLCALAVDLAAQRVLAPPKRTPFVNASITSLGFPLSHFLGLFQYGLRHSGFAHRAGGSGVRGYHLKPQRRQVSCLISFAMAVMVSITG